MTRQFCFLLLFLIAIAGLAPLSAQALEKPNIIVVILGDDIGWFHMGPYKPRDDGGADPEPRSARCRGHDVHRLLPEASCGPRQLHHGRARIRTGLTTVGQAGARPSVCRTRVVSLSTVERAFRRMRSVDLKVRPIYVLLCTPAYYVERHVRTGCYSAMQTTMRAQAAAHQR